MKKLLVVALLASLGACSTQQISGGANAPLAAVATNTTIHDDLLAASFNIHKAVEVGALAADDPVVACIDNVLVDAGLATPSTSGLMGKIDPPASFTPEHKGVASDGAVAYILARQAEALLARGAQFKVSAACKAIIGQIVIDAAKVAKTGVRALLPLR